MLIPVGVSSYILALSFRLLHTYACLSNIRLLPFAKMEATKQRALIRASAMVRKLKEKEGTSTSAPKLVGKGVSKRKSDGKDDCPLKNGPGLPVGDKQLKKSSPPKLSHRAGKGLMTVTGLVTQGTVSCLLTHKEHAIEMVESIIKETDLDPFAEQTIEDLGASGLFDLSRVRFSQTFFHSIVHSLADSCLDFRCWCV